MEITQKKFSNTTTFDFRIDRLRYAIKDSSGRHAFDVDYADVTSDISELDERNAWFRNAGFFWIALGILQIILRYSETGQLLGSLWLWLGLGCLALYRIVRTSFSIVSIGSGRISVIKDSQHDKIMAELMGRRKKYFLEAHGQVNLANDPERELAKFKWLRDEEIISDAEYNISRDVILAHTGRGTGVEFDHTMLN
jgi:hypothetical protein